MPTHPNPDLHHPSNERVLLLGQAAAENGIGLASSRLDSIVLAGQKALHRGALASSKAFALLLRKGSTVCSVGPAQDERVPTAANRQSTSGNLASRSRSITIF